MSEIDWSKAPGEFIDHDEAIDRFDYCPKSGRIAHSNHFHSSKNGMPALNTKSNKGYLTGTINGRHVKAHRFIYFWMTGRWPAEVDHIDGNKENNAWLNLREVTSEQNQKNRSLPKVSKTGIMGVSFRRGRAKPFIAAWQVGKQKTTKSFDNLLDAACHRKSMEARYEYSENHGR